MCCRQWLHHFFEFTFTSNAKLHRCIDVFFRVAALVTIVLPALRAVINCCYRFARAVTLLSNLCPTKHAPRHGGVTYENPGADGIFGFSIHSGVSKMSYVSRPV